MCSQELLELGIQNPNSKSNVLRGVLRKKCLSIILNLLMAFDPTVKSMVAPTVLSWRKSDGNWYRTNRLEFCSSKAMSSSSSSRSWSSGHSRDGLGGDILDRDDGRDDAVSSPVVKEGNPCPGGLVTSNKTRDEQVSLILNRVKSIS